MARVLAFDGTVANLARAMRRRAADPAFWAWEGVAVGILFRVAEYAKNRPLWMDEEYLLANVQGRPIFDFTTPMVHDQLAPPGFLAVARAWVRVFGGSSSAIRLLPLMAGIAALFALRSAARRYVGPRAVAVAVWLCVPAWELIYYATEFKPYAGDFLVALLILRMAGDLVQDPWGRGQVWRAALLGVGAAWFSLPSIFVLAGAGLALGLSELLGRRWRRLGALLLIGAAWLISFGACFAVSQRLLGASKFMWTWWDFAFLPLPPRSTADLSQMGLALANAFLNPAGMSSPFSPIGTAALATALFAIGVLSLAARGKIALLAALLAPIALGMVASALRRYPFHGRLSMYLVPSLVLLVAQGLDVAGRRLGRLVFLAIVALLIAAPAGLHAFNLDRQNARQFDSHGDPRNDLLDYLEEQRLKSLLPARKKSG